MRGFGARFDAEIINTPSPLSGSRAGGDSYTAGPPTTYIHFLLNQRTLPHPACQTRDDGWCELSEFLAIQSASLAEAEFDYACNGAYPVVPYGTLTNGVPDVNETFVA